MTDAATGGRGGDDELMFLHVDSATERVTPMPPRAPPGGRALAAEHAALPAPRPRPPHHDANPRGSAPA